TGVMLATDLMRQVSYLSDNTSEQTRKSAQAYQDARDHLAPYKRVLDVYTSRWFGNAPSKKDKFDSVVEFLKRDDTQAWLEDPLKPENRLPKDDYMKAGEVAKIALKSAEEKRFFHWELEFPEVFFAPSTRGGQDVQLDKEGGFDAVVGNPPYIPTEQLHEDDKAFFIVKFTLERKYESSVIFTQVGLQITSNLGLVGTITPIIWQTGENYSAFRKAYLQSDYQPVRLVNLPFDVFPDAYVDTGIQIIGRPTNDDMMTVLDYHKQEKIDSIDDKDDRWQEILRHYISHEPASKIFMDLNQYLLRQKLTDVNTFYQIGNITDSCQGIVESFYEYRSKPQDGFKLEYRNLDAYRYEYSTTELKYINMSSSDSLFKYYTNPRVLIRRIVNRSNRLMATLATESYVVKKDLNPFILNDGISESVQYVLAIINSSLSSYLYTGGSTASLRDDFRQTTLAEINDLPIRKIDFTTPEAEREQLAGQIIGAYDLGDNAGVLRRVRAVLADEQSDVVHDVLTHLAQVMIDLNKNKQAEVKRFLDGLEKTLGIIPKDGKTGFDVFGGKTIIQDYLGDYQKGEGVLAYRKEGNADSMERRLYENRNRYRASFDDVLGKIEG
ncbi:MAG: TaqI-like C-terminal specificity domain-containing protein, partial [Phototrophicaceae bacterium]